MTKHINAYVVVFSLVTVLALATASECHSITYLPSLRYGALLWGWWGVIASVLWRWGKPTWFLSLPSVSAIAVQLLAGTTLGVAHLLLMWHPGRIVVKHQSPRHRGADLWIRFWNDGSDPISAPRPIRRHGSHVAAEAALERAPAGSADAVGAPLSLQYLECDYDAGRVRQAAGSSRHAATSQLDSEEYVDPGHSAKSALIAGVGVSGELPCDRAGSFRR